MTHLISGLPTTTARTWPLLSRTGAPAPDRPKFKTSWKQKTRDRYHDVWIKILYEQSFFYLRFSQKSLLWFCLGYQMMEENVPTLRFILWKLSTELIYCNCSIIVQNVSNRDNAQWFLVVMTSGGKFAWRLSCGEVSSSHWHWHNFRRARQLESANNSF